MYLNALFLFDCIIGNSSSGIIEVPLVKTKVLNIGERQKGRYKFGEVIDVPDDFKSIKNAVNDLLNSTKTKLNFLEFKNLYAGKSPSEQIIKTLKF